MKIKILETGKIKDAILDDTSDGAYTASYGTATWHCKSQYEIIQEPPQPRFKLNDVVKISETDCRFRISKIEICCAGYNSQEIFYLGEGCQANEESLTLSTEPEKPKTYKYVECGQLNGEQIFKKVGE